MGKQSRRKRNAHANSKTKALSSTGDSNKGILSKIKHTDPKIRDATLSALAVTLFNNNTNKLLDYTLVNAVCQRISIDTDISSACAAIGCILNYISSSSNSGNDKKALDQILVKCDALNLVLHRLNNLMKSSSLSNKNDNKLIALTLELLCIFIEQGDEDLIYNQLVKNSIGWNALYPILTHDIHSDSNNTGDTYNEDCRVGAARALHALLDCDNDVALDIGSLSTTDACSLICKKVIINGDCASKARLHSCGIVFLLLSQLIENQSSGTNDTYVDDILSSALTVLSQYLDYNVDIASALAERLKNAKEIVVKEEEDEIVERTIDVDVKQKSEKAKDIARRQKTLKKEKETAIDTTDMEDEPSLGQPVEQTGPGYGKDSKEDAERALSAWQGAVQPLKLALEIVANMLCNNGNERTDNIDDWASDDEDRMELVAQSKTEQLSDFDQHQQESVIMKKTLDNNVHERVFHVLSILLEPLNITSVPTEVTFDLMELRGKCASCVNNFFLNIPSSYWNESNTFSAINLWRSLGSALALADTFNEVSDDISSAMLSIIRNNESVSTSIQESDLKAILHILSSNKTPEARQNAATMLGCLCAAPHSKEVDDLVCHQLVVCLQEDDSIIVSNEVLCAIMDIYGRDDAYGDVFIKYDVLSILQKFVNVFKRKILEVDESTDPYILKETMLNTKRFIKYKQLNP